MKTALTVIVVTFIVGVGYWLLTGGINTSERIPLVNEPTMNTYENADGSFRFSYPLDVSVRAISSSEIVTPWGTSTVTYPEGSIEIPGLFIVSRIPFSEFSEQKPVLDYHSCCSGERYWYDSLKNTWQGEKFQMGRYETDGTQLPEEKESLPLSGNSTCSLVQMFGSKSFYKVQSGDEGIPTDYYYFLLTDQGYAIRFLSQYDLRGDYSSYAEAYRPDPIMLQTASKILSSFILGTGVREVKAACS